MWIGGSRAVQLYYTKLRIAGAQVRKVLIANAAQRWGVDPATLKTEPSLVVNPAKGGRLHPAQLKAEPSLVVNPANGERLSYGEIASFGTVPEALPAVDEKELK